MDAVGQPGQSEKRHVAPRSHGRLRRQPVVDLVAAIVMRVLGDRPGPLILAVGGAGGTGKSTFAVRLARRLGDAAVLSLDDYKTSRATRHADGVYGPHPKANKLDLIADHLSRLRAGQAFDKPVYDRTVGEGRDVERFRPACFNLVDGEVATYREFRDLVHASIFIDADWRTQLNTRLDRDLTQRAYSPEKAVATFLQSNLREFSAYGAESKRWADMHLFCHNDYRLELESLSQTWYDQAYDLIHESMDEITLAGLIVPLLTPFDVRGEIDRPAFANHLGRLADAGVKRVLVGGTCGEFFSMVAAERLDLLKLALEYFPGLVLFQVGGGPLAEARELASQAQSLGADGVLCLPPSFFADAPPDGLSAFLTAVAEVVDIPFMLYNFPRHTGNPLTAAVLKQVDHFGIKDSAGDLSLAAVTPRYFSGNDASLVAAMARGAIGFFSGGANVYPADYVAIERAFEASDAGQAADRLATVLPRVAGRGADEIPRMKHLLHERFPDFPATVRPPLSARMAS